MIRRALALYTLFCLALGFFGITGGEQRVVCRMTGMPMAAVVNVAPAEVHHDCCAHAVVAAADVIGNPPCCQVRSAPEKAPVPAAVVPPAADLVAWAPTVFVLPVPLTSPVPTILHFRPVQAAPRGPPDYTVPARAPPFFS